MMGFSSVYDDPHSPLRVRKWLPNCAIGREDNARSGPLFTESFAERKTN